MPQRTYIWSYFYSKNDFFSRLQKVNIDICAGVPGYDITADLKQILGKMHHKDAHDKCNYKGVPDKFGWQQCEFESDGHLLVRALINRNTGQGIIIEPKRKMSFPGIDIWLG